MKKQQILNTLAFAKPEHMEWLKQGYKILDDVPKERLKHPQSRKACNFGKWYYEEGYKMIDIPQLEEAEKLHRDIHELYTKVFYSTFERRKKARSAVLTAEVEVPVDESRFRQTNLKKLQQKTVQFILLLGEIEKIVEAKPETDFDNGWYA